MRSIIVVSGLSSSWLWNQKTGRISTMPIIVMKKVKRPMATEVALEKERGRETTIDETGRPAMSRMVNAASRGCVPNSQKPPE